VASSEPSIIQGATTSPVSSANSTPEGASSSKAQPQLASSDAAGSSPGLANRAAVPRWSLGALAAAAAIFFI